MLPCVSLYLLGGLIGVMMHSLLSNAGSYPAGKIGKAISVTGREGA
jgi:hypothetical protein